MILILAEAGTEGVAHEIARALSQAYSLPLSPDVVSQGAVWARSVEWDDLLFVLYKSNALPDTVVQYVQDYRSAHKLGGAVIPISTNPDHAIPPNPISGIKAAKYDGSPELTRRIVKSAGVFLGLALRPGSQRIFVSYRASDGKQLAQAIYDRLKTAGFKPWLDEAEENLVIGDAVQDRILSNIESAAMVLLVDTPDAPDSKWVTIEIDIANSQLVPVLPIVVGGEEFPRFVQLQGLRRHVPIKRGGIDNTPLADDEWQSVKEEIDELLLSAFRRRLRILSRAQAIFEANGYNWRSVDERLRMYRADKKTSHLGRTSVMSHCLVHDITYLPALRAYWTYLKTYPDLAGLNQKLCIYDREKVLSEAEIETLSTNVPEMNAILAHYNELELLVASNFTALRK